MFEKLKGLLDGGGIAVYAPVAGDLLSMTQVDDPTFRDGMLGVGVAIKPTENRIVAPVDGVVALMFDTGHAVSVTATEGGAEVLIHVGLDTVRLKGEHFKIVARTGDAVKRGDPLIEFDREAIAAEGYDTITPVVITNADEFSRIDLATQTPVEALDRIMSLHK